MYLCSFSDIPFYPVPGIQLALTSLVQKNRRKLFYGLTSKLPSTLTHPRFKTLYHLFQMQKSKMFFIQTSTQINIE